MGGIFCEFKHQTGGQLAKIIFATSLPWSKGLHNVPIICDFVVSVLFNYFHALVQRDASLSCLWAVCSLHSKEFCWTFKKIFNAFSFLSLLRKPLLPSIQEHSTCLFPFKPSHMKSVCHTMFDFFLSLVWGGDGDISWIPWGWLDAILWN